ncbi:MAG: hypothetical protein MI922_07710, partial [Bacteroidales bacterium]|nr:hypothetical protein [Bacteroidales bacterium]
KLSSLKNVKEFYLTFDYSDMSVGEFHKEADYVEKKANEAQEKGDKSAEEWKAKWVGDRTDRYEPKFIELFNDNIKEKVKISQEQGDLKWKMDVHTIHTEPGFNVGVMRKPAMLDYEITFSEIANPDNKVVVAIKKSPGQGAGGYDFDAAFRIQESYAKCGKELAKLLLKKAYK